MRINDNIRTGIKYMKRSAIQQTLRCRVGLTRSGTRNKGTSMKQGKTGTGGEKTYVRDERIIVHGDGYQ